MTCKANRGSQKIQNVSEWPEENAKNVKKNIK